MNFDTHANRLIAVVHTPWNRSSALILEQKLFRDDAMNTCAIVRDQSTVLASLVRYLMGFAKFDSK